MLELAKEYNDWLENNIKYRKGIARQVDNELNIEPYKEKVHKNKKKYNRKKKHNNKDL